MIFDIEKTCAVTGHRSVGDDLNLVKLKSYFSQLIDRGVENFLVGMAVGFDMICFDVLSELKQELKGKKQVKIVACVPCKGQDAYFSESQKIAYKKALKTADEVIVLKEKYTPKCMIERNSFMVDNAKYLVCYLRKNSGGTFYTVNYAKRLSRLIAEV